MLHSLFVSFCSDRKLATIQTMLCNNLILFLLSASIARRSHCDDATFFDLHENSVSIFVIAFRRYRISVSRTHDLCEEILLQTVCDSGTIACFGPDYCLQSKRKTFSSIVSFSAGFAFQFEFRSNSFENGIASRRFSYENSTNKCRKESHRIQWNVYSKVGAHLTRKSKFVAKYPVRWV